MFWIFGWIFFGLLVGLIARAIVPGEQPVGLLKTMLLGIAGSFVGGLLGFVLVGGALFQSSGWVGSVIGAVMLILLQGYRQRKAIEANPGTQVRLWEV